MLSGFNNSPVVTYEDPGPLFGFNQSWDDQQPQRNAYGISDHARSS